MRIAKTIIVALVLVSASAVALVSFTGWPNTPPAPTGAAESTATPAPGGEIRDFTLEIVPTDIDTGAGLWRAWSFNGQVPGPTLTANVGDILRVTVVNKHNLTHSFHTHLAPADLASDGSQINTITGIGGMAMIPPGESYTYTLKATLPGISYYHCHSAAGGHPISHHMAQGLYGAILIKDPAEAPIKTEVVMMGERGFDVENHSAPYFIMNGKGLPGGERKLEEVFAEQGVAGVVAQLGKTIPIMRGRVGEPIEIAVINIGDAVHTFHMHGMSAYSQEQQPGHPVPAQTVQLAPGAVDRIRLTPTDSGLWLFHCHVVTHADQGMIGVFLVDPKEGELKLPDAAPQPGMSMTPMEDHGANTSAAERRTEITITAGPNGEELTFSAQNGTIPAGNLLVTFVNEGDAPHSLSFGSLGQSTGTVPGGASKTLTLTNLEPGTYDFICAEPGHAGAGMTGSITIT